ncbi:MAG: SUMF1/EgtB/PvdO family nonheme iron enzyme, partial [Myxococcota bacterium]|nr:SUMF1/EgtB/PvdO family nonheme iron enzyme [Myxococcota bacterium]
GKLSDENQAIFMPHDAKDKEEGISLPVLQRQLRHSGVKHTLIINDSLDAGIGLESGNLVVDRDWNVCSRQEKHSYFSVASTQNTSILENAFTEGLNGLGDLNKDAITVDDELLHAMRNSNPISRWESAGEGCTAFRNDKIPKVRDTRFKIYETVRVSAGKFKMGSQASKNSILKREDDPQHEVRFTRDIYVGKYEITYDLWEEVGNSIPRKSDAQHPVHNVNWYEALAFANALSEKEGVKGCYEIDGSNIRWPEGLECDGWRLPTESEWEYFSKAGSNADFATPSGQGALPENMERMDLCRSFELSDGTSIDQIAWFCGNASDRVQRVGQKEGNRFGIHDTAGNVWEWVWDWYDEYPSENAIVTDPIRSAIPRRKCESTIGRARRGGSWENDIATIRPAFRSCADPNSKESKTGFRLVRTAKD